MRDATLTATAVRERGLLNQAGMEVRRRRASPFARARSAQGFSLIELLVVVAIIAVLAGIAIGVTPSIIQTAKGQSGAQQLAAFLKRHREMAISRRRNIEIAFTAPNQVPSVQRAVPGSAEPAGAADAARNVLPRRPAWSSAASPASPIRPTRSATPRPSILGGANPVMFTSEGSFTDVNGNPINASVFLGVPNQVNTANALTIIGTTATVRTWRWDGSRWVQ